MFLGISGLLVVFWFVCLAMRIVSRIVHFMLVLAVLLAIGHFRQNHGGWSMSRPGFSTGLHHRR